MQYLSYTAWTEWQMGKNKYMQIGDILSQYIKPFIYGNLRSWRWMKTSHWVHYSDIIMGAMASQIISLMIVYSNIHSGTDRRKH